jgi:hypothetical protein
VRLEELNEIGNLKADAVACYRPVNSQELFAVEHIALCQQQMLRGFRVEAGLFTTALDYCLDPGGDPFRTMHSDLVGDGDIEITRAQNRNFAAGEGMRRMVKDSDVWSILLRYKINAERQYRRAVEDFERLKRLRPEMPNHPNIGAAPDVIDDIVPPYEIGGRCPRPPAPRPAETTPAAETLVETPAACPNTPENNAPEDGTPLAPAALVETLVEAPAASPDVPEDGAPLAPAAASSTKAQLLATRIRVSAAPETGRLKVNPSASLRRPNAHAPGGLS